MPQSAVHTFILNLPQLEVQKVDLSSTKKWLRPYYAWQVLTSKRRSAFARLQGQFMLSFSNTALVKQLELYHEQYSHLPRIVLLDELIHSALKPHISKTSPWIFFAYDEEDYTSLCVFKDHSLILKRRFLKQYTLTNEIQATLKYLARHGYMGEKVCVYYLDAPQAHDSLSNAVIVNVPCDRVRVVEEGLKQLSRKHSIKTPLIPSMTEATAEEKLRRGLLRISVPALALSLAACFIAPFFVSKADEDMQNEYYAVTKKDEKVILFEQLSQLNATSFDVTFLKKIKTELDGLMPTGVQVDLRQQVMQLSMKSPDHVIKQKSMKLSQVFPLYKISAQKNILTLAWETKKEHSGGKA